MIGTARYPWRGTVLGIVIVAMLTLGTVAPLIGSVGHGTIGRVAEDPAGATVPVQRWWADSHTDVEELRAAIDDTQHGLAIGDDAAVAAACQRMHDAGELKLGARLPAPEPALTAALSGAIEDTHAAAHLCLAAVAGSQNHYAGEFRSDLEQAEHQLQEAQGLVNKILTEA